MARTLDPNELVAGLTFIDTAGIRHEGVTLPRHMLNGGSQAAKERWLISQGIIADPAAPILDTPAPEQVIQTVVDTAALSSVERRLQALEQRPAPILPTEAALVAWSQQAARVGLVHAEMAALADSTVASCEATAAAAQSRLDGLDAQQQALTEQVSSTLSDAQAAVAETISNASQQLAGIESEAIDAATAAAKKAATPVAREAALAEVAKHWGSSVTIAAELPTETDPSSWAKRWYGRDFLIPGDGALVETPNSLRTFRFTGRGWVEGGTIEPKVVAADIKASVLDASVKQTTLMSGSGSSPGLGGGGGESLLSRTVATGGGAMLSESARWAIPLAAAGLPAPDACTITIELTAADSGNAGKKLFVTGKAIYEPLATPPGSFTVYSELGELVGQVDVEFSIQVVPAVLPPSLPAATLPPGVLSAQVFARITSNTSGATQFLLAGAVSWLQPNAVVPAGSTTPPQIIPAWTLI